MSQGYDQFQSNFHWLPEICDRLLDAVVNAFFNEVKKGWGHTDKILVAWDVSLYEVGQEVAVASLFLSLKHPGHDPGVWWLSSSPRGGWG